MARLKLSSFGEHLGANSRCFWNYLNYIKYCVLPTCWLLCNNIIIHLKNSWIPPPLKLLAALRSPCWQTNWIINVLINKCLYWKITVGDQSGNQNQEPWFEGLKTMICANYGLVWHLNWQDITVIVQSPEAAAQPWKGEWKGEAEMREKESRQTVRHSWFFVCCKFGKIMVWILKPCKAWT